MALVGNLRRRHRLDFCIERWDISTVFPIYRKIFKQSWIFGIQEQNWITVQGV